MRFVPKALRTNVIVRGEKVIVPNLDAQSGWQMRFCLVQGPKVLLCTRSEYNSRRAVAQQYFQVIREGVMQLFWLIFVTEINFWSSIWIAKNFSKNWAISINSLGVKLSWINVFQQALIILEHAIFLKLSF